MSAKPSSPRAALAALAVLSTLALAAACGAPVGVDGGARETPPPAVTQVPDGALALLTCVATPSRATVECADASGTPAGTGNADVFGGQNVYVAVASSNSSYDGTTFEMDVTLTNLMPEKIGTPDGVLADTNGIRVFFFAPPRASAGTGTIDVVNPDGVGTFTGTNQPYYEYRQILGRNQTSAAKRWRLTVPSTVTAFTFSLAIATEVQPLIVINEVLVNPAGSIPDGNAEWFEVYNAGARAVDMQGMYLADSAASGRRPYHRIASPLVVEPGGYVVLGNSANEAINGGVAVNYTYGGALALANSLDAIKISRQYGGTDSSDVTMRTIDEVRYRGNGIATKDGISRELLNPALDNHELEGPNWADASVTSIFGAGGRGTPGARNSAYTP